MNRVMNRVMEGTVISKAVTKLEKDAGAVLVSSLMREGPARAM